MVWPDKGGEPVEAGYESLRVQALQRPAESARPEPSLPHFGKLKMQEGLTASPRAATHFSAESGSDGLDVRSRRGIKTRAGGYILEAAALGLLAEETNSRHRNQGNDSYKGIRRHHPADSQKRRDQSGTDDS